MLPISRTKDVSVETVAQFNQRFGLFDEHNQMGIEYPTGTFSLQLLLNRSVGSTIQFIVVASTKRSSIF